MLDPFAGCATTPIAPNGSVGSGSVWTYGTGRMRSSNKRMEDNRQLLTDPDPQIHYVTEPPERTDDAEEAVPFLQVTERYKEPAGPKMSRQEMFEHLIAQNGQKCQGCDRDFRRSALPATGSQHAPRGRRDQSHHESRAAVRAVQHAEVEYLYVVRTTEREHEAGVYGGRVEERTAPVIPVKTGILNSECNPPPPPPKIDTITTQAYRCP